MARKGTKRDTVNRFEQRERSLTESRLARWRGEDGEHRDGWNIWWDKFEQLEHSVIVTD